MRNLSLTIGLALIAHAASAASYNGLILDEMRKMPSGGKYSTSHVAKIKLQSAAHFESGKFFIIPTKPYVSFCSGATYLVFIKTIEALREHGDLQLDFATLKLVNRITVGKTSRGEPYTREGMTIRGDELMLLPEDESSRLFVFRLKN